MKNWEKIVVLHPFGENEPALRVNDAKTAARILLQGWPVQHGRSYRRAILACSAAIHGKVPQDTAQWAFVVAAMEAVISYEIIDWFDTEIAMACRELLAEDVPPQAAAASVIERNGAMPPFWWPKRQASGQSAR